MTDKTRMRIQLKRKLGKKGAMLLYIATLALLISVLAFLTIKVMERPAKGETRYIGEDQIAVMNTGTNADKFLLFIDQAAKPSAKKSIFTLAQKGGYSSGSDCGQYLGYEIWVSRDKSSIKDCTPDEKTLKNELSGAVNNELYDYLNVYWGNLPSAEAVAPTTAGAGTPGDGAGAEATISYIETKVGDSTIKIKQTEYAGTPQFKFMIVHDDENTASQAANEILKEYNVGGIVDEVQSGGPREISFSYGGKKCSIDPNRIFTPEGRAGKMQGCQGDKGAQDALVPLAEKILGLSQGDNYIVVLHNNDPGGFGFGSYKTEYRNVVQEISGGKDSPDDLVYVTKKEAFDYFKSKGYNVVLQRPGLKAQPFNEYGNDGSMSVAVDTTKDYINIEAQGKESGHIDFQKKIIIDTMTYLNPGIKLEKRAAAPSVAGGGKVIAIDAGHGTTVGRGCEVGAAGEAEINQQLTDRLKALAESAGYTVVLTRNTDCSQGQQANLESRAQKGLDANADVFVDIHNDCTNCRGSKVIIDCSSAKNYRDECRNWGAITGNDNSIRFGDIVAKKFQSISNTNSVTKYGQYLYFLRKASESPKKAPTIILEVSNSNDPRLKDDSFKQQVAQAILDSINEYFGQSRGTNVAQQGTGITGGAIMIPTPDKFMAWFPKGMLGKMPPNNFDVQLQQEKGIMKLMWIAKEKAEFDIITGVVKRNVERVVEAVTGAAKETLDFGACKIEVPTADSKSIGSGSNGRLENAAQLSMDGPYAAIYSPAARARQRNYGTTELVEGLQKWGCLLKQKYNIKVAFGDMGAKEGGDVGGHVSHESGRDVDLGLIFKGDGGVTMGPRQAVSGGSPSSDFDLEANWFLVDTMFKTSDIHRIFLDNVLKNALISWAKSHNQDPDIIAKAQDRIRHENGHGNHYHVRLACPKGDSQCTT